ncbi:MAG TPA: transglutaminase family protein [Hyphomicrobiaceae bacterium]|nr:transglutaminase family protein [Hyphomicrobiaceae bacterium]
MIYDVSHRTTYAYRKPVLQSQHLLHLTPLELPRQRVLRHSLLIEPAPSSRIERRDYFGNHACILSIEDEHSELVVHARSTVQVLAPDLPMPALSTPWEQVAGKATVGAGELDVSVLQFVSTSRHTRFLAEAVDYARPSFAPGRPILEAALDLTRRIFSEFTFDPSATDISTPVAHVLAERRGVCQDFAHLAITCLRALGLPARYVSGYLLTYPPPGMEKLKGADASHAWVSVWAAEAGWVDFDPTNGVMPAGEHITLAYGRDYEDVSPIGGVLLGGSRQSMTVAVDVAVAGGG